MDVGKKLIILVVMLWLHILDDYYLQGILAKMKQKAWWKENAPQILYINDYKTALITHAFSWSFVVMVPIMIRIFLNEGTVATIICYIGFLIWNTWLHMKVDNDKANNLEINLTTDQIIHIIQIFITWFACVLL